MNNIKSLDLSQYHTIFCDSTESIKWAYKNGLPKTATIKTSSPAVLWNKNPNIHNVEEMWNVNKSKRFQDAITNLMKDIYSASIDIPGVERELALQVSQSAYKFQKIIYKAACLCEADYTDTRLFIYVEGKTGPQGNIMNSPWDQLLSSNPLFLKINHTLTNDKWETLTTKGVSYYQRYKIAGYETMIYRIFVKLIKILPDSLFKKEVIMPNENELNIEIASSLILRGVKVTKAQLDPSTVNKVALSNKYIKLLCEAILPIIREQIIRWVTPSAVEATLSLFKSHLKTQVEQFILLESKWKNIIVKNNKLKQAVLVNSPGNIKGRALSSVCSKRKIPLISSQHGVTVEISESHKMLHFRLDNTMADLMFSYNHKIADIEKNTYFNKSKHYVVGMPSRLIRMKSAYKSNQTTPQIIYISTNLYRMGFSLSLKTDYMNALDEYKIITDILGKLPYKVCYKTYPEDNRRYSDKDPILKSINNIGNIEVFSNKIDMRYLISKYRIFITTCATSTLSWPVMSGKPVIFINQKNNNPLTNEAYISLSRGLFVFNDDDENFYKNLKYFLSQPINEIERLWEDKRYERKKMIREYFSEYDDSPGKRVAHIIDKELFG